MAGMDARLVVTPDREHRHVSHRMVRTHEGAAAGIPVLRSTPVATGRSAWRLNAKCCGNCCAVRGAGWRCPVRCGAVRCDAQRILTHRIRIRGPARQPSTAKKGLHLDFSCFPSSHRSVRFRYGMCKKWLVLITKPNCTNSKLGSRAPPTVAAAHRRATAQSQTSVESSPDGTPRLRTCATVPFIAKYPIANHAPPVCQNMPSGSTSTK